MTGAELGTVASRKIFKTRGWGEIARVCHAKGALAIHFEYNDVSVMFSKVFDEEGRRLECCPEGGHQDDIAAGAGPSIGLACSYSSDNSDSWWSSDSPEPLGSPETSDDSYVPPNSRRARSRAVASGRRCR